MAGDSISATTQYYYQNAVTNTTGNNLTTNIVTALIQSILGSPATGLAKGNTTPISTELNADPLFLSKTAPDANNATGTNPKAYMTIVFFDERFNYVAENSMALRVSQQGDNAAPLVLANIKAPKNGFAYVYLSNESSEPVYFDNFTVSDNRGRIIEEDHYYAYGLKIAGISSKKLGDVNEGMLDNKNLYNDKELIDDADLDWYDYGFRNYDPQIGRFTQLDPLTDSYPELTNYQYASNEPIGNVDMDGLEALGTVGTETGVITTQSAMKEIVMQGVKHSSASFLSVTGNFFKGFGKDIWGAVKGTVSAVVHLDKTIEGLANLSTPQGSLMAGIGMYQAGSAKIDQFKNGNANVKAEIIGAGVGEIFQLFGGEAAEAGKVGEVGKLAEVSGDVEKASSFVVTKEGIVLPKGAKIPSEFEENVHRSSSFGTIENQKFVEKVRIDPGTPSGFKGPNDSHFHLNDGKHIFDQSKWTWW